MAWHDYKCPECGATIEDQPSEWHQTPPICPSCGEAQMEKLPPVRTSWKFGEGA